MIKLSDSTGSTFVNQDVISGSSSGNDTIYGTNGSDVFQYASGDGDDVIRNFSGEDVLQITSGSISSYSISGGDLIFTVGDGTITLKNMANHYVSIQSADGTVTYNQYTTGVTQQSIMQTFVQTLANSSYTNSTAMLNEAVQAITGFSSMSEALNQFLSDCQNAESADIFLRDYCGIDLANEDTGALVGWDAGGSTIYTAESIIPESGSASSPSGYSFSSNGLTITYSSGLTSSQQIIVNDLYTWWLSESLDLINESYGLSFASGDPSFNVMDLNFYNEYDGVLAYVSMSQYFWEDLASEASLYINMYYYGSITASNVDGISSNTSAYLDRTLAHELTHAVMGAYIADLPSFFEEGMAELTAGIDDERYDSILYLAGSPSALSYYVSNALSNSFDLDSDGYAAAYMFFRWLVKQGADSYSGGSSTDDTSSGSESSNDGSITSDMVGLDFTGSLVSGENYVSIDSSNNISVTSSSNYNAIISVDSSSSAASLSVNSSNSYDLEFNSGSSISSWNVTMSGGNDTIEIGNVSGGIFVGGSGNDYFDIDDDLAGNVTVLGGDDADYFHADSDSVSSPSSRHTVQVADINFDEGDVILTDAGVANLTSDFFGNSRFYNYENADQAAASGVYSGTVFNASNVVNDLGMSFSMARMADTSSPSNSTAVVWANSSSATIDFSDSQTEAVLVFTDTNGTTGDIVSLGGNYNDTIHAGSNDLINAGGGNDQIYIGNSNNVTVEYSSGDGNDIVYGFSSDDVFNITGTSYSSVQSGNNLIVTVDDSNVTLVGSSSSQTFNINFTSTSSKLASDSLWGNDNSETDNLLSLTSSDSDFLTVDDVTSGFVDEGLVLSTNDNSSLYSDSNLTLPSATQNDF